MYLDRANEGIYPIRLSIPGKCLQITHPGDTQPFGGVNKQNNKKSRINEGANRISRK